MKVDLSEFKANKPNKKTNNIDSSNDRPCEKVPWQKKGSLEEIDESKYIGHIPNKEREEIEKELLNKDKIIFTQKEKRNAPERVSINCTKCGKEVFVIKGYDKFSDNFICDQCIAHKMRDFI